ncbi:MAG: hypothetical protein EA370_12790 [Wenzhouxiangella sp.]|nr:MAG: hypothetical protein EA370_12790 [Wenzhouxiangella sp.]
MTRLIHWLLLVVALISVGLSIAIYKHRVLGYPLQSEHIEPTWIVQARIQITPGSGPIKASLKLPTTTPGMGQLRENFISRGYGLTIQETGPAREAVWTVRRATQRQSLYYQAVFYRDAINQRFLPRPGFPEVPSLEEPFQTAMLATVEEVRRQSADIATFTTSLLTRINSTAPTEELALFLNSPDYRGQRVKIAQEILAGARIPSVQVNGFYLADASRTQPVRWLAVHNQREWLFFDPATGQMGLPENFLVWWVGAEPPIDVEGATLVDLVWSIRRNELAALDLAEQRSAAHATWLAPFSLFNLPVQAQSVYAVLMLVPVGAFIMILMRNVVGMPSFGTFMPVLIALAFRETGLLAGLVMFTIVVAVGLSLRFYLARLHLLLVPRLTAVLIIVVFLMVLLSLASHSLGWEVGLSVGLFPMVILAMIIERMSIVWEERGPSEALKEGLGSAVIAALAFSVMTLALVQHMAFVFPELMLVMLGLTILMGRYSGYRLSELLRFRVLARKSR